MSRLVTRTFLIFLSLGALPLMCGVIHPAFYRVGLAYDLLLALLLAVDFILLPNPRAIGVTRSAPRSANLGRRIRITLRLENGASRAVRLVIRDSLTTALEPEAEELSVRLPAGGRVEVAYDARARVRGDYSFGPMDVRAHGRLGLALRQWEVTAPGTIRVFPDLSGALARLFHTSRGLLREAGMRASPTRGQGREFDHLRSYVPGDEYRWIDWKATARKDRLVSREYQSERNQHVMILIDAGRRMTAPVGEFSRLDYAVHAALQLVHLGLLRGDHVGILAFADSVKAFLAPAKGRRQLNRIAERLVNLQPELCEPDYDVAFNTLAHKVRRRSLVVAFTEVLDSESSKVLILRLGRLVPRHLPLCVSIADPDVPRAMLKPVGTVSDVYDKAVARELYLDTQLTLRALETMGAHVIHVPADRITAATLRRDMDIKHRGLL